MADKEDQKSATITIKKYANRRLYNTATSSYVTLDHLCQMVKDGLDFVVYDAKTGEDITRSVLTQIIVEEESKGQNLLPISFLRQLIGFYGDNMQWMVPRYLEYSMQSFSRNQEQMRDYFQNTLGGMFPFGRLEEVGKQNMAMFERAMRMFSPFGGAEDGQPGEPAMPPRPAPPGPFAAPPAAPSNGPAAVSHTYEELQKQIDDLQKQIASIAKPARPAKPEGK
ncbi:polyhydroxyalkanoate synthesis repressor PhaR [Azospirillum sp. YIM DDC1]|uniref:Polyhydroxyalkanoate synthesis repressor PhaR n=1 Tax=Azospirillum aestuarii TaxID=2802052 RepID=A0ABS1I543_9PROT|nr:polyhydroxyalkanoate synthesis repressor PhaR [Azospirillum aestuarii]MBK4722193.1 polyhydroxyalkanoate synthesis repressor PhaR [Azospirillum aestuarii]TWA82706.1 polyhydroxyalkanoate synthesis repressor PhaR [Azospirillum brasilense]